MQIQVHLFVALVDSAHEHAEECQAKGGLCGVCVTPDGNQKLHRAVCAYKGDVYIDTKGLPRNMMGCTRTPLRDGSFCAIHEKVDNTREKEALLQEEERAKAQYYASVSRNTRSQAKLGKVYEVEYIIRKEMRDVSDTNTQ